MNTAIVYKIGQRKAVVGENVASILKPVIFAVLLFLVSISFAADASNCQYATFENKTRTVQNTYINGEKVTETVVVTVLPRGVEEHRQGIEHWYTYTDSFKVANKMKISADVHITYTNDGQSKTKDIHLPAFGNEIITEKPYDRNPPPDRQPQLLSNNIEFSITSSGGNIEERQDPEAYQEKICKQCPAGSGTICANDGERVNVDMMCGSGHKNINGICTSKDNILEDIQTLLSNNLCWIVGIVVIVLLIVFVSLNRSTGGNYGGSSGGANLPHYRI